MQLVDNAKKWYRMFSVQALMFIGAAQGLLIALPARTLAALIPFTTATTWNDILVALSIVAAVLGFIGRLVDQGSTTVAP